MNYDERENMWDEQWPRGGHEGAAEHPLEEPDNLDEEEPFPNVVGSSDVIDAVRDSEPYMPPTDPPVLPGGREGIHMETGFGTSAVEEAAEEPLPRGDEDIRDEALLLLRQDSLTSTLPLDVDVDHGVVYLRGQVSSIEDADHASTIIGEYIPGVVDVVDDTTLANA